MTKEKDEMFLTEYSTAFTSVPEFIRLPRKGKVLYIKKKLLMDWFNKHNGKNNLITADNLAQILGFETYGGAVALRSVITSLQTDDNQPIVSCSKGYYKALTKEDYNQMINNLETRKKGLDKKIKALVKMRDEMLFENKTPIPFESLNL